MKKFYDNKEYFWEYDYYFGEDFLKSIFLNKYKRKYSMVGDGIYNLIFLDNKIYDVRLKETKSMLPNDGKKAFRDSSKDEVVEKITEGLSKLNLEYTINSGKFITFKIFNYIGKIEIVKKNAIPE